MKVLVVEDHEFFRQSLVGFIRDTAITQNVEGASNGIEALAIIKQSPPDLILMDIEMPEMNGLELLKQIKDLHLENPPKILMITSHVSMYLLKDVFRNGANGYAYKDIPLKELQTAIAVVRKGGTYIQPVIASKLGGVKVDKLPKSTDEELTEREIKVLQLTCKEFSNPDIAAQLSISILTVLRHKQNIRAKIGAKTTAGCVAYALKNQLISYSELELSKGITQ